VRNEVLFWVDWTTFTLEVEVGVDLGEFFNGVAELLA
jgi:hypothetical protein